MQTIAVGQWSRERDARVRLSRPTAKVINREGSKKEVTTGSATLAERNMEGGCREGKGKEGRGRSIRESPKWGQG